MASRPDNEKAVDCTIPPAEMRSVRECAASRTAVRELPYLGRSFPHGSFGIRSVSRTPQEKLWLFVQSAWPGQAEANYRLPIAGRRFEADIAFPRKALAIEVDGWNFHGKRYGDFQRDRDKGNALAAMGWTLLRFPAIDVQYKFQRVVNTIQATMVRLDRGLS